MNGKERRLQYAVAMAHCRSSIAPIESTGELGAAISRPLEPMASPLPRHRLPAAATTTTATSLPICLSNQAHLAGRLIVRSLCPTKGALYWRSGTQVQCQLDV